MASIEEVEGLVVGVHQGLLEHDKELLQVQVEREEVEAWHAREHGKVEAHFAAVVARLAAARDAVVEQLAEEALQRRLRQVARTQALATASRGLQPELDGLQAALAGDPALLHQLDLPACRARLAALLRPRPPPAPQPPSPPAFHPAPALAKLRAPDFGFLQLAEFLPASFTLLLSAPSASLPVGSKAVCTILTDSLFTEAIQANIKFSIRRQESREAVPFCREDCHVSADLRSFQLAFLLLQPGEYTVTVLLYDQQVRRSPLHLSAVAPGPGPLSPFSPAWGPLHPHLQLPNPGHHFPHLEVHPGTPHLPHLPSHLGSSTPRTPELPSVFFPHHPGTAADVAPNHQPPALPLAAPRQDEPPAGEQVEEEQEQRGAEECLLVEEPVANIVVKADERRDVVEVDEEENEEDPDMAVERLLRKEEQERGSTGRTVVEVEEERVGRRGARCRLGPPAPQELPDPRQPPRPRSGAEGRRPTRSASRSPRSASVPARRYPAAATVRPAPPLRAVDLPSLLARRPAGRAAVTAVTMVLEAPLAGRHLAATLHKPIGICLLRDKCVVVASTFENKVKMFTGCGQFLREVAAEPGRGFRHPSDMTALAGGGFAVRDQVAIRCYEQCGKFVRRLDPTYLDRFYGLAEDGAGHLVTINENKGARAECRAGGTAPGEADLLFFSLSTGQVVRRVELADVIADKERSKCRFLTRGLHGLVITDLGMDRVYVLDPATRGVTMFGGAGSGPGRFADPAGLAVDSQGNMLVADSRNHRLCLHDPRGNFLTQVKLDPPPRRPSGLLLDGETGDLYLLNLQGGQAVVRYNLQADLPH